MADIGVSDLDKNEPKNIQELTQYVRAFIHVFDDILVFIFIDFVIIW
jgi:hypothetical protein